MSLLCRLGFHRWHDLTGPAGFIIHEDWFGGQYAHATGCDRCGEVLAYVSDRHSPLGAADYHRNATQPEVTAALRERDPEFYRTWTQRILDQFKPQTKA